MSGFKLLKVFSKKENLVIVGAEFLLTYPWEYLSRAFEFSRKFFFKWTVNFRFLPEEIFLDSRLHLALLALHLTFLVLFCAKKWLPKEFGSSLLRFPISVFKTITGAGKSQTCPLMTLTMILTSNFIGMVFARSLHYQVFILDWQDFTQTISKMILLSLFTLQSISIHSRIQTIFYILDWIWNA